MPEISERILGKDARKLGCKPRHVEADYDCGPELNTYLTALGDTEHDALNFDSGWWELGEDLNFPERDGGAIFGAGGGGDILGHTELAAFVGSVTRFVNTAATSSGVPMFDLYTAGTRLSDFLVQGYSADTRANVIAGAADWADIGIKVRDRTPTPRPTGGHFFDNIGIACCKTGLELNQASDGDNGSENYISRIGFNHCNTGIHARSTQQVNLVAGVITGYGVTDLIHAELGGQFDIGHIYYGAGSLAQGSVLKIGNAAGGYSHNADKFHIGTLALDGSATTTQAINIGGSGHGTVVVDMLHLPENAQALQITITGAWTVIIRGGGQIKSRAIKFLQDPENVSHLPTCILDGVRLHADADVLELVSEDSESYGNLRLRNIIDKTGQGTYDGGWPWYDGDQTWLDGGLVSEIVANRRPTYTAV